MAEQAQETHALERQRQREHEQRQAKIRRTERWVDDCCAPAYQALLVYARSRIRFVAALSSKLEEAQPETFARLYHHGKYSMRGLDMNASNVVSALGAVCFDPTAAKSPTWTAPSLGYSQFMAHTSPATVDVTNEDAFSLFKGVYVRELPQAFFELMAADLDGSLAEDFRGYVRHELKPAMDRVTAILHDHYAAIEMPSKDWLMETFAGHVKTDSTDQIVYSFIGYTRAWNRVLMQWDAGHLDELFPHNHMMPFHGMYRILMWCVA